MCFEQSIPWIALPGLRPKSVLSMKTTAATKYGESRSILRARRAQPNQTKAVC
jgi:hypothetical protein